ncbi:methionine ABC transporter ATP-binding protein [Williamsia sterculiae]|uniref:ABC-type methionine transport system, ATPase component n=1 Tax=Williamsia sterculiae TaxID=1344003 RepID=A0A1N7DJH9_9NOCA|nr:ATP-binding cassette domain-containing protein [Williamsia sterculiae]SIR75966.1 ABC-type methionine transport system, ATPase component [Williamsia sterculiae]
MIEISNLTKVFGSGDAATTVLDDVDFAVPAGEIFAVVGPSGAGKSTLAQCINLLERPTSGEVIVNGESLTRLDAAALRRARRRIGTVFQSANLLSRRTAAENVALPLDYLGVTKAQTRARVAELLDRVGLADQASKYPHQLSGGQRQRVGIARALALRPSVLLSDEATSGLDPRATDSFLSLLREVRDELDLAVVFITHEMDTIVKIADRVGRLDRGRIAEQGSVVDLLLDPGSELGAALRPSGSSSAAPVGLEQLLVTHNSVAVPADWLSRITGQLGTPISVLGGNVQDVDGVSVGQWTIAIAPDRVHDFTSAATPLGLYARPVDTDTTVAA